MSAYLDGNEWIQSPHGELEGLEKAIFVGEHTELSGTNAQADASINVLRRRFEPSIPLGLGTSVK